MNFATRMRDALQPRMDIPIHSLLNLWAVEDDCLIGVDLQYSAMFRLSCPDARYMSEGELNLYAGAQRLPDQALHEKGEWQTAEYLLSLKVLHQPTQEALSRRAGQVVYRRTTTSTSLGKNGPSSSKSEHEVRHELLPAAHFGRLAPREFVLFHDKGVITGKTGEAGREQRDIPFPEYDPRKDVLDLGLALQTGDLHVVSGGVTQDEGTVEAAHEGS
ncbi:MAG: hypothetical protein ACYCPQ_10555 [Elusimicrobiota bacterium]